MDTNLDLQFDAILRGYDRRQLRRCQRCKMQFALTNICDGCLRAADANFSEKRRILLPDVMRGDELSAAMA